MKSLSHTERNIGRTNRYVNRMYYKKLSHIILQASDIIRETITPFTIAKLVGDHSNLSATATEWYPGSPQPSNQSEVEYDPLDIGESDTLECISPDHLGFVPYDYPMLTV